MDKSGHFQPEMRPIHSDGMTPYETILVIFCCFLHLSAALLLGSKSSIYKTQSKIILPFVLDFFICIVPTILSLTLLAQYNIEIAIFQISLIIFLSIIKLNKPSKDRIYGVSNTKFITNFRALTNIVSLIAILAVDFNVFPRRFAKTKTFGFSLMDAGVGLFIFSNGIVSAEARNRKDSVRRSIIDSVPLLLLGIGRFMFVNQTDYKVPISEYGVHWNFFITLAIVKIFSSLVLNVMNIKYIYINAALLIISHEIFLQSGLSKFVLRDDVRDNFWKANKEGLVSSLGYISLYLFSVYFGHILYTARKEQILCTVLKFIRGSFICGILTVIFQSYFGISRRMANGAYCFWILFIAISFLGCLFIFQEFIHVDLCATLINEAANYNGLAFFLIGNVFTGLVNLSIDTYKVNDFYSLLILVIYMFVNCCVVCILYSKKIKLKI